MQPIRTSSATMHPSFVDSIPKSLLLLITIPFTLLTLYAGWQFGLIGIFQEGLKNSATQQIFMDLLLCGLFFIAWLKQDAKRMNRNFIFWTFVTLAIGSFGPLMYLLTRKAGGAQKQ